MTIASETAKAIGTGDGSTTSFSFSMVIQSADQIVAYHHDGSGTYTLLTQGTGETNYQVVVSSYPGSGSVTYPASGTANIMTASEKIIILRKPTILQETDLQNSGGYFPETQEDTFDFSRIVDLAQQEQLDRTIKIPMDETDGLDLTLPSASDRADKLLGFTATGAPTALTTFTASTTASAFVETLLTATTAQSFINTLTPIGQLSITDTDVGAGADPTLFLDRNSASPADDDDIGRIVWSGKNDAAETALYARLQGEIADASDGTEDGRLQIRLAVAGDQNELLVQFGEGALMSLFSEDQGGSYGPRFILDRNDTSPMDADNSGRIIFRGENDNDENIDYAGIHCVFDDVSDGTEDGHLEFSQIVGGTEVISMAPGLVKTATTTSGTTSDITGIPSTARKITVTLNGVSTDGTSNLRLQIGDSGGVETTGYSSCVGQIAGTSASELGSTAAFILWATKAAASTYSGVITLRKAADGLTWIASGNINEDGTKIGFMSGKKTLSATLDRVRLTSSTPNNFDAGSWTVLVE